MALWCNGSKEVLQLTVPESYDLGEILAAVQKSLGAKEAFHDGHSALTIIKACLCDKYRSVSSIADEHDVWLIPPVVYHGGWETHRVLARHDGSFGRFVSAIKRTGRVQVLSKKPREHLDILRDLSTVPVHFFEGLTDRQLRVLVKAYESGVLDVPARARMDEVAREVGVSRSTFGEHLRKAQLRLLQNSYPFLKLRTAGDSESGA